MKKVTLRRRFSGFLACMMFVVSVLSGFTLLPTKSRAATSGAVKLRVGDRVEYSGYSTNYFYINDNLAYCLEPIKDTPPSGDYAHDVLESNQLLAKALYYVVGAPGSDELPEGYWQMADPSVWGVAPFGERYAYCHMFLGWIYSGFNFDAAFMGTSLPYQDFYEDLKVDFWAKKAELESWTVPDASLKITPETGKATWDITQGIQRTEDFTLNGDSRNGVTIPAPDGTTVYNRETGQSGSSVTVKGGQHFYFTSGIDAEGSYTSSEIKGSMNKQWKGIIFNKRSTTQTMGGYSYAVDPIAPVTFKIDWADRGKIHLKKESADKSVTHDGVDDDRYTYKDAQYGIYRGSTWVETMTADALGDMESGWLAPSNYQIKELSNSTGYLLDTSTYNIEVKANQTVSLTVKEQPQKGKILLHKRNARTNTAQAYNAQYTLKGAIYDVKNSKGALAGTIITDVNGEGNLGNLGHGRYTVQEKTPSVGFQKDTTVYTVEITSENRTAAVFTKEVTSLEKEQMGKITLQKVDSETGKAEPQGAASLKNALYDIFRKSTYKPGDNTQSASYAGTLTTNEQGQAESASLYLDTYYAKERVPSPGYLLDETLYEVTLTSENREAALFTKSVQSKEKVIRGDVQIAKFASDLDGEDENDIKKSLEGIRFPFQSVTTGKIVYTIVTDKYGFGTSKSKDYPRGRLPYDTYIVTEENTPEGFMPIAPFRVTISKEGVTLGYIIENKNIVSAISVVKKDAETGDTVPVAGTEFRLLDQEKNIVTMKTHYPKNETHETFKMDERGSFIFPEKLSVGTYYLEEVNAPIGMLKGGLVKFEVTAEGNWEEPLVIEYSNENVKGQITLKKTDSDTKKPVQGAVYGLYAAEDIVTADTTIRAQKDDLVQTGTTDEKGEILFDSLYLGKYYAKEISPATGFTLDETSYPVELEYIDQETPLVKETIKVKDEPTKVQLLKVDSEVKEPLEGAVFEVWNKNTESEKKQYTTEEEGKLLLTYYAPGTYCVQEVTSPAGYGQNGNIYEFTIGTDGLIEGKNDFVLQIENDKSRIVKTTACDKMTGSQEAIAKGQTTIVDKVAYANLVPGQEYTLKGVLMDKASKEPFWVDGKEVTAETIFKPEKSEGTVTVEFSFDASSLTGKKIVVFEKLYMQGKEIASHEDIKDKEQTIEFPQHHIQTAAQDKATASHKAIAGKQTILVDTVSYKNLISGQEYTLNGILMDKENKKPLLKNGKEVTGTTVFKPEKSEGAEKVTFTFDASGLDGNEIVVFEKLYVQETEVAAHEDIKDKGQTVEFPKHQIQTEAQDKATGNHKAVAGKQTTIVDTISYENLISGQEYTLKGVLMDKESKKPLLRDGKAVTGETVFQPEKADGKTEVTFTFDASGLDGESLIVFEKLYVQNTEVAVHTDLEDAKQTIGFAKHSIGTTAKGKNTGTQEVSPEKETVLVDTVQYKGLIPGQEYTLKGILMDKEIKEPLLVDEKEVTAESVFQPEEAEGETEVTFTLNTEGLAGKQLVVFEKLYVQETEVAAHEDIEDQGQTIAVVEVPKVIKTGDQLENISIIILGLLSAAGMMGAVLYYRRKQK